MKREASYLPGMGGRGRRGSKEAARHGPGGPRGGEALEKASVEASEGRAWERMPGQVLLGGQAAQSPPPPPLPPRAPTVPAGHPAQPPWHCCGSRVRGAAQRMGMQSAWDLGGLLLRGSVQSSHAKGRHRAGESVPGTSVLPLSAQGVQVALEVAPTA